MTVSSPMSVQAKGEPAAIVPATMQMPKAMIPAEIRNENAASMLTSIPKKSVQPKSGIQQAERSKLMRQPLALALGLNLLFATVYKSVAGTFRT